MKNFNTSCTNIYDILYYLLKKLANCLKKKNLNCAYKKFVTKNYIYGECVLEN